MFPIGIDFIGEMQVVDTEGLTDRIRDILKVHPEDAQ